MYRTHRCNEIREAHIGQIVELAGWVDVIRDHGGVLFVDLRDETGVTQVVVHDETLLKGVGKETVISAKGTVTKRDENTVNPKIDTGLVELVADSLKVLGTCTRELPFEIGSNDTNENLRLKHRFLDLRNPALHNNILLRSKVIGHMRKLMEERGFLDIQTPILTASSPEGARDFLVPSRKHPGKFYALPQAPQQFKQLLMVSGFDRYYQIAPCFRDEDARADRSPGEFYQLDFEMAFSTQEEVLEVCESVVSNIFKTFSDKKVTASPFRRIPYAESMAKYGSDKPDLRFGMEFSDITDLAHGHNFSVFDDAEYVVGFAATGCATYTRKQIDALTDYVKRPQVGAKGLIWIKVEEGGIKSSIDKFFSPEELQAIAERLGAKAGDLCLILCGKKYKTLTQLCALRLEVAEQLGLRDPKKFAPLWVVDFPMFEWDEETERFYAKHHPFTSPKPEDIDKLESDPGAVRANAYDFVCNGTEIGGGSIRIHDPKLQSLIFKCLGFTPEQAEAQFGFLINAFRYGAPPHGGLAFGFDRLCSLFGGVDSIRDFIAFPKNNAGRDVMLDGPSPIDPAQLEELYLSLVPAEK